MNHLLENVLSNMTILDCSHALSIDDVGRFELKNLLMVGLEY